MLTVDKPIEQLARLLAEQERMEENIRDTESALALIKRRISESLVHQFVATCEERIMRPDAEELMREEKTYERLLQALVDMKAEINKQIRPIEEQIIQANLDHLRQNFERERQRLGECLEEVDKNLLECRRQMEEYERIAGHLHSLNSRISRLGGEPLLVPDSLPSSDLSEVVRGRLEELRSQGRL
jgi:hypothetical protein